MGNELKFTLGLATGGFLSGLAGVESKVKGFLGSMVGMGAIVEGVLQGIETGAALNELHKRTGESVGDLVKLQSGFKAAGLAAEDVGPALFQMQKALGGVNEFGQGTAATFNRMHLSISKLKNMGAPQAMAAILASLKGMNQSDAVKAASVIFGRGEAGNMIQLARSSGEFGEGMAKAAAKAKLFQENAAAFEALERTMKGIKDNASTLFAGIAAGLAPTLQQIGNKLSQIDFTKFGEALGDEITIAFEAIDLGRFGEYFKLVLESAAFDVGNLIGKTLQKAYAPPTDEDKVKGKGGFWSKYGRSALASAEVGWSVLPLIGGLLHIPGAQRGGDWLIEKAYSNWQKSFDPLAKLVSGAADVGEALHKGGLGAGPNPYTEPLAALRAGLLDTARKKGSHFEDVWTPHGGGAANERESNYKPDFTSLEKMGFVMSGLGNADSGARIADNTRRGADAGERTAQFIQDFLQGTHPEWTPVHEPS